MKKIIYPLISALAFTIILIACQKDDDSTTPVKSNDLPENSTLRIHLTDARGDYKAVYVDVKEIEVNYTDINNTNPGWVKMDSMYAGVYDLIKLSNGLDTLLGSLALPAGRLNQIRLVLGDKNSVVLKSLDSIPLSTPSAQQSGLKISVTDSILAGITYNMTLDFDAGKSVVQAGKSGKYNLKPVIRAYFTATSGAIKGNVIPNSFTTAAVAIKGTDSIGTYTNSNGDFLVQGLIPGTYDVYLVPGSSSGYKDTLITGVGISTGSVADIGSIQLQQ